MQRFGVLGIAKSLLPLDKHGHTGLFQDFELGKITADEFRDEMNRRAGLSLSHDDYRWAVLGYVREVPERHLQLLRKLRIEGYKLFLLSNTNPYMMSWAMSPDFDGQGRALRDYFDTCYLSYELGLAKPDPRIFHYVLEQENLNPATTLFVDDSSRNTDAARELGLQTMNDIDSVKILIL